MRYCRSLGLLVVLLSCGFGQEQWTIADLDEARWRAEELRSGLAALQDPATRPAGAKLAYELALLADSWDQLLLEDIRPLAGVRTKFWLQALWSLYEQQAGLLPYIEEYGADNGVAITLSIARDQCGRVVALLDDAVAAWPSMAPLRDQLAALQEDYAEATTTAEAGTWSPAQAVEVAEGLGRALQEALAAFPHLQGGALEGWVRLYGALDLRTLSIEVDTAARADLELPDLDADLARAAAAAEALAQELEPPAAEVVTDSGLRYVDGEEGTGEPAAEGDFVAYFYVLWLEDGTRVFNNLDRGAPARGLIGGQALACFDEGLVGMRAGGVRRLIVPPALAFGEEGREGKVPPDATLQCELRLVSTSPVPEFPDVDALDLAESPSGLRWKRLTEGEGERFAGGAFAEAEFLLWKPDGTLVQSSYANAEPFVVEEGTIGIEGFAEAFAGMRPGERRVAVLPAELGFGDGESYVLHLWLHTQFPVPAVPTFDQPCTEVGVVRWYDEVVGEGPPADITCEVWLRWFFWDASGNVTSWILRPQKSELWGLQPADFARALIGMPIGGVRMIEWTIDGSRARGRVELLAAERNEEQLEQLRACYAFNDADRNGIISFREVIRGYNLDPDADEHRRISPGCWWALDLDGDRGVSQDELQGWLIEELRAAPFGEDAVAWYASECQKDYLARFDTDGNKVVTSSEYVDVTGEPVNLFKMQARCEDGIFTDGEIYEHFAEEAAGLEMSMILGFSVELPPTGLAPRQ